MKTTWINKNEKLPENCYQVAVLMWNMFNETYEYGIGIYDIPTKKWEITGLDKRVFEVSYWIRLPEEPNTNII